MDTSSFYVIKNNVVENIIVADEQYAKKFNLKQYPIFIPNLGMVEIGWTYLPNEDTFLPPPRDILAEWQNIRNIRNSLLVESDQYVLMDRWLTYNQDEQEAFRVYREKLRNIPQDFIDPKEVVWPNKPWVEIMESIKPLERI